jgi:5-methylcytosine-specific restriction endonuclease McrA
MGLAGTTGALGPGGKASSENGRCDPETAGPDLRAPRQQGGTGTVKWNRRYDACTQCGSTDRKHYGGGLCALCYQRRWTAAAGGRRWSKEYDRCVRCGTTQTRHSADGLCSNCYQVDVRGTEEGKRAERASLARYNSSPQGRAARASYARLPGTLKRKRYDGLRRREWRHGISAPLPDGYEALVMDVFGHRCAACGTQSKLVFDHHQPLQRGHALLHNAVLLCRSCNARKFTKAPEDFYDSWVFVEVSMLLTEVRRRYSERLARPAESSTC